MSLAVRVKLLIDSSNLSVTAAAKKCGIPQPRLNDIVLGRTLNPRSATVSKIAQGFGVTEGWLLTGESAIGGKTSVAETPLTTAESRVLAAFRKLSSAQQERMQDIMEDLAGR